MSYTFGANTGDDITTTNVMALFGDNTSTLVMGWWYPTTLTATRKYWGAATIIGAEIDTTTSEIRMRTDNTTDGQWLTSGANITTNKWHFIAWLNAAENTTVAGAWRVWVGDAETIPQEVTVTNPVARSGNYTAQTTFSIGNAGNAGAVAFEGDVGWVSLLVNQQAAVIQPLTRAASGVIQQWEADNTYLNFVLPAWKGKPDISRHIGSGANWQVFHIPLDFQPPSTAIPCPTYTSLIGINGFASATIGGATYSSNEPPTKPIYCWPFSRVLVRR